MQVREMMREENYARVHMDADAGARADAAMTVAALNVDANAAAAC